MLPLARGAAIAEDQLVNDSLLQPPALPSVPAPYSPQAIEEQSEPPNAGAPAQATAKKKPSGPPAPYKGVFYDNDFSYLTKPDNKYCYLGDCLKRNACGDCWIYDLGGEYRARHHHEVNLRGSNLSGSSDDFLLHRTRLYANVEYSNWFRFYGEAIDAVSEFEDFTPRTIEENRFDALNLFADGLISDYGGGELWGRVGRQELLYGEQRLISPLDWANTRRTFDGAKVFYRGTAWDIDGFWTRPVPFSQHVNSDSNFDHPDQSQEFMGLYATYKGRKDHVYDFYFLRLAEYDGPGTTFAASRLRRQHVRHALEGQALLLAVGSRRRLSVRRVRRARPVGRIFHRRPWPRVGASLLETDAVGLLRLGLGRPRPNRRHARHVQPVVSPGAQVLWLCRPGGAAEHQRRELHLDRQPDAKGEAAGVVSHFLPRRGARRLVQRGRLADPRRSHRRRGPRRGSGA